MKGLHIRRYGNTTIKIPWSLRQGPPLALAVTAGGVFALVGFASAQPWAGGLHLDQLGAVLDTHLGAAHCLDFCLLLSRWQHIGCGGVGRRRLRFHQLGRILVPYHLAERALDFVSSLS
jgi:hypothetical protein